MPEEITPLAGFIVKARARELAKTHDKILGTDFLAYLEKLIVDSVNDACHFIGPKKIVRAAEYEKHRATIAKYGGGR